MTIVVSGSFDTQFVPQQHYAGIPAIDRLSLLNGTNCTAVLYDGTRLEGQGAPGRGQGALAVANLLISSSISYTPGMDSFVIYPNLDTDGLFSRYDATSVSGLVSALRPNISCSVVDPSHVRYEYRKSELESHYLNFTYTELAGCNCSGYFAIVDLSREYSCASVILSWKQRHYLLASGAKPDFHAHSTRLVSRDECLCVGRFYSLRRYRTATQQPVQYCCAGKPVC